MKSLRQKPIYYSILILFSLLMIESSCDLFEGPCADEDLGHLALMTSLNDIGPFIEDVLIYFKDSAGNEQSFEFLSQNVGHTTEQHSSTNIPCPSDESDRKEFKAVTEEYYFSIFKTQSGENRIGFGFNLSVRLQYFNGLMVSDMLEVHNAYITNNPLGNPYGYNGHGYIGYGGYGYGSSYDGVNLITHPRDCSEEYLSQFAQPIKDLTLLERSFQNVYASRDSNLFYNYEFGIIGFKDDTDILWVLDRIEKAEQ